MNYRTADISIRYSCILLFSVFYNLMHVILAPLTLYSSYFILSIFYSASLHGNAILFDDRQIELIDACISGLAYLLLIVLNLSAEMPLKKRLKALFFSLAAFFAFNLARILLLSILFISGSYLFNAVHMFFWYAGSLLAVLLIWFVEARLFEIKSIPFASDIRYLIKKAKRRKRV